MKQWQLKVGNTLELPTHSNPSAIIHLTGKGRAPDEWQPGWIVQKYFGGTAPTASPR
jgi:hypothetical protein